CTQANSAVERFTPSSRYVLPAEVTMWLPDTCSAGAAPPGGGELGGWELGGWELGGVEVGGRELGGWELGGGGVLTPPVQVVPLSENDAGTGFELPYVPWKPIAAEALVPSDPFQLMLTAVTCWPDCDQVALQPLETFWFASGNAKFSVQPETAEPRLVTFTLATKPPDHWLCR